MLLVFTTSFLGHDVFPTWPKTELCPTIGLLHIVAFRSAKEAFVLRSFAERKATLLHNNDSIRSFRQTLAGQGGSDSSSGRDCRNLQLKSLRAKQARLNFYSAGRCIAATLSHDIVCCLPPILMFTPDLVIATSWPVVSAPNVIL